MRPDAPEVTRFRELLRQAIDESAHTVKSLADELGVGQQTISNWCSEREQRYPPAPDVIFAIEDALDVPGMLCAPLGFDRPGVKQTLESAIAADPTLLPEQREDLLVVYRQMQSRAAEQRRQG
jgi:transcriptional regulator with XRE-family HTH domain